MNKRKIAVLFLALILFLGEVASFLFAPYNSTSVVKAAGIVPATYYTVTYDGNGSTGGSLPVDGTNYIQGEIVSVKDPGTLDKIGSYFIGWNTKPDGSGITYQKNSFFSMGESNIILYAQWANLQRFEAEDATLNFDKSYGVELDVEGASGDKQVGSLDVPGRFIEFSNLPAAHKGFIRYASINTGKVILYVNDQYVKDLNFTSTGAWRGIGNYATAAVDIQINDGDSLKIQYDDACKPLNVDYIDLGLNIPVNSINISESTLNLIAGGASKTLTAMIEPVNATIQDVIWSSSNTNVATVVNGIVTPVSEGTAIITASTKDGSLTATCDVTVAPVIAVITNVLATNGTISIILDKVPTSLPTANDFTATYSSNGNIASNLTLTDFQWKEATRTVQFNYLPIQKTDLSQNIDIAVSYDGGLPVASNTFIIDPVLPTIIGVDGVILNEDTIDIALGTSNKILIATVVPFQATNKNVSWSSSDESVVTVDNGVLTTVSSGTALITVTTEDGNYSDSCEVTVMKSTTEATSVSVNSAGDVTDLEVGNTLQMSAVCYPTSASYKEVTWGVINGTGTASISSDGLLIAGSKGKVTVLAIVKDGSGVYGTKEINITSTNDITPVPTPSVPPYSVNESSNTNTDLSSVKEEYDNLFVNTYTDINNKKIIVQLSDKITELFGWGNLLNLKADVFYDVIKSGKNLSVVVKDKTGRERYIWMFQHDLLKECDHTITDINLHLEVNNAASNSNLITALKGKKELKGLLSLKFAHEGKLPAQAGVKIYVGDQVGFTSGKKVYLYRYNKNANRIEALPYSPSYTVDEYGYITMQIVTCSDYLISLEEIDSTLVTSLREQIMLSPSKKTLYVGKTRGTTKINITMPDTMERVESFNNSDSESITAGLKISFSSNNKRIATVDQEGKITAVKAGTTVITTTIKLYDGTIRKIKTTITVKNRSKS